MLNYQLIQEFVRLIVELNDRYTKFYVLTREYHECYRIQSNDLQLTIINDCKLDESIELYDEMI